MRVCSNAPKVELFLNNVSQGTFSIDHAHGRDLVGHWKLPYEPGTLCALAYDEYGNVIAEDQKVSFGDPVRISMHADKTIMKANGHDLIFVEICVKDKDGNVVENAKNRVKVEVSGAGRLVGLDNGDSTDFDQYQGVSRRLFSGRLLAVIASRLEPGRINIRVSGTGLVSCEQRYEAVPSNHKLGISASRENRERQTVAGGIGGAAVSLNEIPARKIELKAPKGQVLTPECRQLPIEARVLPGGIFEPLTWRVTNDAGIDTNQAMIQATEEGAVVTALGDGDFYVRCSAWNRGTIPSVLSVLEFSARGLGPAVISPYEEVCGGLYSRAAGRITAGNEQGVMFAGGESMVAFDGLDFGEYGTDQITLPIFSTESTPIPLQIWKNMPGEEGSELLGEFVYQKPSKWMVYQEETYTLSKRLRGVTTLCIVSRERFHLRGFVCKKYQKAFETLPAVECSRIYGDMYQMTEEAVLGIGNNVSLEFDEMDFGEKGAGHIVICGKSSLEKNTVHVRFQREDGSINQIAEFAGSEEWSEQRFDLETLKDRGKIVFVFLPGCQFDFCWFRFEE